MQDAAIHKPTKQQTRDTIRLVLRLLSLCAAITLIVLIAHDTLINITLTSNFKFQRNSLMLSLIFMAGIGYETFTSSNPGKFALRHIISILVTIPICPILLWSGVHLGPHLTYGLQILPMIRAAYIVSEVTKNLSTNRFGGILWGYISLLLTVIFFSSMTMWVDEHIVNPQITDYWNALWWAIMDTTTTGSSIVPVTPVCRALSFVLSLMGLITFPVFTLYLTKYTNMKQNSV